MKKLIKCGDGTKTGSNELDKKLEDFNRQFKTPELAAYWQTYWAIATLLPFEDENLN